MLFSIKWGCSIYCVIKKLSGRASISLKFKNVILCDEKINHVTMRFSQEVSQMYNTLLLDFMLPETCKRCEMPIRPQPIINIFNLIAHPMSNFI